VQGLDVVPVDSLLSLVACLRGLVPVTPCHVDVPFGSDDDLLVCDGYGPGA